MQELDSLGLLKGRVHVAVVDVVPVYVVPQADELVDGYCPVLREDLGRVLAPRGAEVVGVSRRDEPAEQVEALGCAVVLATLKLEQSKVVQLFRHLRSIL